MKVRPSGSTDSRPWELLLMSLTTPGSASSTGSTTRRSSANAAASLHKLGGKANLRAKSCGKACPGRISPHASASLARYFQWARKISSGHQPVQSGDR
jgi:hypothetical protein